MFIPYSAKFVQVCNFENFANFQSFAKIFQQKFLTRDTVFMLCIDGQYPVAKLPNPQETLQGDTFEVGIALLTAVCLRGRQCANSKVRVIDN